MSNIHLKKVLKAVNVLYISKDTNYCQKTINTLNFFFNEIRETHCTKKAYELYQKSRPAAIITDIDFPKQNGIDFIKEIRKTNKKIPIIILSEIKDKNYLLEAIKLNLIDYLLHPIDTSKLITAINNVAKDIIYHDQHEVVFKNKRKYNYILKTITDENNKNINLAKNEFKLLEFLIENKGKKISKEEIELHIWEHEYVTESAYKSLFSRLRTKVGKESIVNTFGVGYSINTI